MSLKIFARRSALGAALALTLTAGQCDTKKPVNVNDLLQHVPQQYVTCLDKVVDLAKWKAKGDLSQQDTQRLIVELRASELRLQRCGKGAVQWMNTQIDAFNAYYGS